MGLIIFQVYQQRRKLNPEGQINLSLKDSAEMEHKAKVVMDLILKYLHEGKDITDEEEKCSIEGKTLAEFCFRVQQYLPEEDKPKRIKKSPENI